MKLKKDICLRCYKETRYTWTDESEHNWTKEGVVNCPWDMSHGYRNFMWAKNIFAIPTACPYKMEHMVMGCVNEIK